MDVIKWLLSMPVSMDKPHVKVGDHINHPDKNAVIRAILAEYNKVIAHRLDLEISKDLK